MTLTRRMRECVAFAKFAAEHHMDPTDLAELLTLADRAFAAGERECNTGKSADQQRQTFETVAKRHGFGVEWNGLGPTLKKAGRDVYLVGVA